MSVITAQSNKTGISRTVLGEICDIAKKHGVDKVILFGSRARGDFGRASDIDLAVSGGDVTGFALDVDENTSTLLMYDIVNSDGQVQQELLDEIARDGVVVYEKI